MRNTKVRSRPSEKKDSWCFQRYSTSTHKVKITQEWLAGNAPALTKHRDWLSGSPNLTPLDCRLWNILEEACRSCHHRNLVSLKKSAVRCVHCMSLEMIPTAIDDWPRYLFVCIGTCGGHFEYSLCRSIHAHINVECIFPVSCNFIEQEQLSYTAG